MNNTATTQLHAVYTPDTGALIPVKPEVDANEALAFFISIGHESAILLKLSKSNYDLAMVKRTMDGVGDFLGSKAPWAPPVR